MINEMQKKISSLLIDDLDADKCQIDEYKFSLMQKSLRQSLSDNGIASFTTCLAIKDVKAELDAIYTKNDCDYILVFKSSVFATFDYHLAIGASKDFAIRVVCSNDASQNPLAFVINKQLISCDEAAKKITNYSHSFQLNSLYNTDCFYANTDKDNFIERIILHSAKRTTYRPWGSFENLYDEHFKLKRITVYPKSRLSLQYHFKRRELWVVTKGVATVYLDGEVRQMQEGEFIYIPVLSQHRLENNTDTNIEIAEVQTGSYFGEDDIVRIDDDYGRKGKN